MPDRTNGSLDERMRNLLCKAALADGRKALQEQADRSLRTLNSIAAEYFESPLVGPRIVRLPEGLDRVSAAVRPRAVMLLNTCLPFGTASFTAAAISKQIVGKGAFSRLLGPSSSPLPVAAAEKTLREVNFLAVPNYNQLDMHLRFDSRLLDVARELWGHSEMPRHQVVERGITLGAIALLHNVKAPLQGLLAMKPVDIIGLRKRVESFVDQELVRYLAGQPNLPLEIKDFRNPDVRRSWRNRILWDFWMDREREARRFVTESWREFTRLKNEASAASSEVYSIETFMKPGRGVIYK